MNTTTTTKPAETVVATERREVAVFQPPRLPYHQAIKERFGVEPSAWKALVEAVYPGAKTVDAVVMALSYCKARNLDPFKRPVHIVPMWDAKVGGYIETIWPGISELRTTAFRTGNYAGSDEAEFGPVVEHNFSGRVQVWKNKQKEWQDKEVSVRAPEWCRVTVYRDLHGRLCKFVGPKVVWLESYATIGKSELPNEMWQSRPEGQLEKCAEAAALRKAFPEELGNELTAEEMAGRHIQVDERDSEHFVARQAVEGPPPPSEVKGGIERAAAQAAQATAAKQAPQQQAEPAQEEHAEGEIIEGEVVEGEVVEERPAATATPAPDGFTSEEQQWLRDVSGAFSGCEDFVSLGVKQKEVMAPLKNKVSAQAWAKAQFMAEDAFRRLQSTS